MKIQISKKKTLLTMLFFGILSTTFAVCYYNGSYYNDGYCISHPSDPAKYFKCAPQGFVENTCPAGTVFLQSIQICGWPTL